MGPFKKGIAEKGGGCWKANRNKQGDWYNIHTNILSTK